MEKIFYRVGNKQTEQGLWYDFQGNFTGLIHDKFDFCENNKLLMDYDPEIVGYISAVDKLSILDKWFSLEDMKRLGSYDYRVHIYKSSDYKFYERYQHDVINQKESQLIKILSPSEYLDFRNDVISF